MTHGEVHELLAAYALDAVSPEEASGVLEHLDRCDECRVAVAEYRMAAASLAVVRKQQRRRPLSS